MQWQVQGRLDELNFREYAFLDKQSKFPHLGVSTQSGQRRTHEPACCSLGCFEWKRNQTNVIQQWSLAEQTDWVLDEKLIALSNSALLAIPPDCNERETGRKNIITKSLTFPWCSNSRDPPDFDSKMKLQPNLLPAQILTRSKVWEGSWKCG